MGKNKDKEKKYYVGIHPTVFTRLKSILLSLKKEKEDLRSLKMKYETALRQSEEIFDEIFARINELDGRFEQLSNTFFDFKGAIKKDILDANMKKLMDEVDKQKEKIRKEALSYSYYVSLLNILFNINACSSQDYQLLGIYLKTLDMLVQYLVENKSWKFLKKFCLDYLKDLREKWAQINPEIAKIISERVDRYSSL